MKRSKKKPKSFKEMLEIYLQIKGLDIIVQLKNGEEVQLDKNRILKNNVIITLENGITEKKIPISTISAVDMYAA